MKRGKEGNDKAIRAKEVLKRTQEETSPHEETDKQ